MSIETEITRIKTNIASAYTKAEEKGATLPEVQNSDNLPATIESITGDEEGWKPEPDWWDIDKILEEDTEDYPAKMICLCTDDYDSMNFTINSTNKIAKIKTSDGYEYTTSGTHNWDSQYDKKSSLGYKTRYFICYFSDVNSTIYYNQLPIKNSCRYLYIKLKNLNLTPAAGSGTSWLNGQMFLEAIRGDNSSLVGLRYYALMSNNSLQLIDVDKITIMNGDRVFAYSNLLDLEKISNKIEFEDTVTSLEYFVSGIYKLKKISFLNTNNIKIFNNAFDGCRLLSYIDNLDFSNATNVSNMFNGCYRLSDIGNISNIKISGLSFSPCAFLNHDTLIRILNALYDYSGSKDTYTIKLGATNLAKLTDEEIAIGTNKNWTIS